MKLSVFRTVSPLINFESALIRMVSLGFSSNESVKGSCLVLASDPQVLLNLAWSSLASQRNWSNLKTLRTGSKAESQYEEPRWCYLGRGVAIPGSWLSILTSEFRKNNTTFHMNSYALQKICYLSQKMLSNLNVFPVLFSSFPQLWLSPQKPEKDTDRENSVTNSNHLGSWEVRVTYGGKKKKSTEENRYKYLGCVK